MPLEAITLALKPAPLLECPSCGARPFEPFMRGQVQRTGWSLLVERFRAWRQKREVEYCAVICHACKEIVGYESGL